MPDFTSITKEGDDTVGMGFKWLQRRRLILIVFVKGKGTFP
ncbi:hypothetical protein C8J23_101223 [Shewanella chilikensis]|uniref:Redoxin domain-containing protein n=1 Tax=Shewanella chilikensis TaxID=558541 RepID=A0ABX5PTM3_9GAMM|nr:hypothetical protein C8J23_101223 [Shewanella chilikensis]